MTRMGYREEYLAKKILINKYGGMNVIKVAIGGAQDYLVIEPNLNRLNKIVEIKSCHKSKYYPSKKDKLQFERIKQFCSEHESIPFELWVKYPYKEFEIRRMN